MGGWINSIPVLCIVQHLKVIGYIALQVVSALKFFGKQTKNKLSINKIKWRGSLLLLEGLWAYLRRHTHVVPEYAFSINPSSPRFWFQSYVHDDPKAVLNHQRLNYVEHNFSEMYFISFQLAENWPSLHLISGIRMIKLQIPLLHLFTPLPPLPKSFVVFIPFIFSRSSAYSKLIMERRKEEVSLIFLSRRNLATLESQANTCSGSQL